VSGNARVNSVRDKLNLALIYHNHSHIASGSHIRTIKISDREQEYALPQSRFNLLYGNGGSESAPVAVTYIIAPQRLHMHACDPVRLPAVIEGQFYGLTAEITLLFRVTPKIKIIIPRRGSAFFVWVCAFLVPE
jgi:hypothetical protein